MGICVLDFALPDSATTVISVFASSNAGLPQSQVGSFWVCSIEVSFRTEEEINPNSVCNREAQDLPPPQSLIPAQGYSTDGAWKDRAAVLEVGDWVLVKDWTPPRTVVARTPR